MLTRVKGTQDIFDFSLRTFFVEKVKKHLMYYNFQEIMTPLIEKAELFQRAVGNETDIVTKEMYFVSSAKEESGELLVLRPEITASVMRAFLMSNQTNLPWKVFTYGPVFRHERPQKGRYREFYQISIELIGSPDLEVSNGAQDAYFLTMLDRLFAEQLMLSDYALLINFLGCQSDRAAYRSALQAFLEKDKEKMCQVCIVRSTSNVLRVLDCKNSECQALLAQAPLITDFLCPACAKEWSEIQNLLHSLSVSYTHMPFLVRGLDYYNKLVFEFVSIGGLGAQNAFCAGGRYDGLARQLGSERDYPALGAALGVERILLLLENASSIKLLQNLPLHCILPLDEATVPLALLLADELHAHQLRVEPFLEGKSLKSMLRKADSMQAATAILLGSDEVAGGFATVKDMKKGTTTNVDQTSLAAFLKNI